MPALLNVKYMDTRSREVYGVLLFLCTLSTFSSTIDSYLAWVSQAYKVICTEALLKIGSNINELLEAAQKMLERIDD